MADTVHQSGKLHCGIVGNPEDWDKATLHGPLTAFDAEFCKAVAVAVNGPKAVADVKVFPSETEVEEALSKGVVDLAIGVSPDATSMWHWKIAFGPPIFYDAQGFLVRSDAPIDSDCKNLPDSASAWSRALTMRKFYWREQLPVASPSFPCRSKKRVRWTMD